MPQHIDWSPSEWTKDQYDASYITGSVDGGRGLHDFPLLPPKAIYERVEIGSANVGPVNKLMAFILMDAEVEWPAGTIGAPEAPDADDTDDPEEYAPFSLFDVTERAVVEQEMCAYYVRGEVQWIDWILEVEPYCVRWRVDAITPKNIATFYEPHKDANNIVRIAERQQVAIVNEETGEGEVVWGDWSVRDVRYQSTGEEQPYIYQGEPGGVKPGPATISEDLFYPFAFGKSVIYRAGKTIQRLLEIANRLRQDDYANQPKVLRGQAGANAADKVSAAMESGKKVVHLPLSDNDLLDIANATHSNMLIADREVLQRDLADITNTMLFGDTTTSGVHLLLAMQQMLNAVKTYRRNISKVFAAFGAKVKWPPLTLGDVAMLLQQVDLVDKLWNGGVLGASERTSILRTALGLPAALPSDVKSPAEMRPRAEILAPSLMVSSGNGAMLRDEPPMPTP